MKLSFRILAFLLVFVTIFCLFSVNVYAAVEGDFVSTPDFWDWLINSTDVVWSLFGISNPLTGLESSCLVSDDHHHHSTTATPYKISGGYMTFDCRCDYCGAPFDCDIPIDEAADQLKQSYGTFKSTDGGHATGFVGRVNDELGNVIVGSSGIIVPIKVRFNYFYTESFSSVPGHDFFATGILYRNIGVPSVRCYIDSPETAPISGTYKLVGEINLVQDGGKLSPESGNLGLVFSAVAGDYFINKIGAQVGGSQGLIFTIDSLGLFEVSGSLDFEVTPLSSYDVNTYTASIGGASSRPSGFLSNIVNGFFGLLDDAGELVVSAAKSIFSETDNTYTNPATGTTSTVTDWTYDYSDRSYHLTTEEGDTVTVTYGDENITIEEGNQTYTVYYVVQNNISGGVCTDGNGHDWGAPTTVPATCTTAGSETQICSKCGEAKTTQLPPLGHKWIVKTTVQTKYDEKGQLLQQGYTIYECERCGEQYKSTDGTGPPVIDPGGSGGDDGGDSIWDAIVEFFKNIASSFASLPDWFSRFSAFLASAFSYLPDEIVLLLTFGVFSVVAIGIWKAVRR